MWLCYFLNALQGYQVCIKNVCGSQWDVLVLIKSAKFRSGSVVLKWVQMRRKIRCRLGVELLCASGAMSFLCVFFLARRRRRSCLFRAFPGLVGRYKYHFWNKLDEIYLLVKFELDRGSKSCNRPHMGIPYFSVFYFERYPRGVSRCRNPSGISTSGHASRIALKIKYSTVKNTWFSAWLFLQN